MGRFNAGGGDLGKGDLCDLCVQIGDIGPVDAGLIDVRRRDLSHGDVGDLCGQTADVRPGDVRAVHVGGGDLGQRDGGQRGVEFVCHDVPGCQFLNARRDGRDGVRVQFAHGRLGDLGPGDAGILDVRGGDGRHAYLQGADRTGLQLSRANGAHGQLHAGDGAAGQLPGGNHAAFQGVCRGAQDHGGVLLRQAVVGVLRHAERDFHTDAPGHHAHAVAEVDALEEPVLPVFLGIRAVDKVHLERHRGKVAAVFVFGLRRVAHLGIALILRFLFIALGDFLCFRDRKVDPLGMRVCADVRAVDVQLWQVQNVAVRVLTGGHDARDHVRCVHIVGDAGEVFSFPDLHVRIHAHAPDEEHVIPVPGQLRAVFVDHPAFAQQGFHRVDVFKAHVLRRGGQVGVEGEGMPRETGRRYALSHRRSDSGGRWLKFADHVVQQVVEDVARVDRDLGEVWHDAIDAERLVAQLTRLDYLVLKADVHLRALLFRSRVGQVLGGHIAVPTVRAGDLVPGGRRLAD